MSEQIKRIFDIPYYQLKNNPLEKSLVTKYKGQWVAESTDSYLEKATKISKALLEIGVEKNDKIAVISDRNRNEWHILDIGVQQIGAVLVPIYPNISTSDYRYIFDNADATICFVSDDAVLEKVRESEQEKNLLKKIYTFDKIENALHWQTLLTLGNKSDKDKELEKIKNSIKSEDLATIIYTSGTTGKPKGVMLSHKNVISNVLNCQDRIPFGLNVALSFLPICHIFERMITYLYQKNSISIYFAESVETIADNAKEVHPDIMSVVPRLIEKVYDKIVLKGQTLSGIKRKLFFWAIELAEDYKPFENQGFVYHVKLVIARKLIFSKWREALGGNLKIMVSGGAALQARLNTIFAAADLQILEGYGLSETLVISVNALKKQMIKVGTVGKPIENVQIKLDKDGEILVKGDNIMLGYYKNPEKTAEVITPDGYFKTGDIGEITPEGLLKITDRKKEMFKTSGGKYIAPQIIENAVKSSRFIEQVMVVGAQEKMPCAFIQPNFDFLKSWIKRKGYTTIDVSSNEKIISNEKIKNRIQKVIDHFNSQLGRWEQIKKFTLTADEWSVDSGHLTPTMKLKRKNIREIYHTSYEKMYGRQ